MQPDELTRQVMAYAVAQNACIEPLQTGIDGFTVMYQTAPTALEPILYQPIFCLVLQGAKQVCLGKQALTFGKMESLIVSVDLPTVARIVKASPAEPYAALALALDMALMRELAEEVSEDEIREEQAGTVATGAAGDALLDAVGRLFALKDKPSAGRVLEPMVRREIHYLLLAAEHGAMLRTMSRADSHACRIARAISLIRSDFSRSLPTGELAGIAGMSVSAFHDHFKSITATTPLQFQKQLRLLEARRLMLAGRHSVSGAAFEVGYESPTQFSREYSRMFGAPPSKALSTPAHGA